MSVIKFPDHFPEHTERYSAEAVAELSPAKRERAVRHIAKMKRLRDDLRSQFNRITTMDSAGECYCDADWLCRCHAALVHAEMARLIAINEPFHVADVIRTICTGPSAG